VVISGPIRCRSNFIYGPRSILIPVNIQSEMEFEAVLV
jgi:hypothetical protein